MSEPVTQQVRKPYERERELGLHAPRGQHRAGRLAAFDAGAPNGRLADPGIAAQDERTRTLMNCDDELPQGRELFLPPHRLVMRSDRHALIVMQSNSCFQHGAPEDVGFPTMRAGGPWCKLAAGFSQATNGRRDDEEARGTHLPCLRHPRRARRRREREPCGRRTRDDGAAQPPRTRDRQTRKPLRRRGRARRNRPVRRLLGPADEVLRPDWTDLTSAERRPGGRRRRAAVERTRRRERRGRPAQHRHPGRPPLRHRRSRREPARPGDPAVQGSRARDVDQGPPGQPLGSGDRHLSL